MGFQIHPFRTLNSLQRTAHRIRLAAEHLQFGTHLKVVGRFGRPAKAIQDQPAIIKSPRIAAAAFDRRGERIERLGLIAGEERMDTATV